LYRSLDKDFKSSISLLELLSGNISTIREFKLTLNSSLSYSTLNINPSERR